MGNFIFTKINLLKIMSRKLTYLNDTVGAIATGLSITAGLIGAVCYFWSGSGPEWLAVWITPLVWSGIIEVLAITAVFITDSDILRAIGGFSMVGVNLTSLILNHWAESVSNSPSYMITSSLHGIALGRAIGTFISTFLMNSAGEARWFNFFNGEPIY